MIDVMSTPPDAPLCRRCNRPVQVSRIQFEVFEQMHYVCFHYEFEHGDVDVDATAVYPAALPECCRQSDRALLRRPLWMTPSGGCVSPIRPTAGLWSWNAPGWPGWSERAQASVSSPWTLSSASEQMCR